MLRSAATAALRAGPARTTPPGCLTGPRPRRQALTALIEQGVADEEFRAAVDPELAAQTLLGPIFYQRLMTSEPFDPNRISDLIDMVLGP